jgi:hypothetical protein
MRASKFPPVWLLALVMSGGWGCEGGADPDADAAGDDGTDAADAADALCEPSAEPLDLVGTWAARAWIPVYMVTADDALVHLCPDRYYGVVVITLRVVVDEHSGRTVRHRFNVCRMDIPVVEAAIDPGCESSVRMALDVGPVLRVQWPSVDYPGGATLGGEGACSSYSAEPLVVVFGTDGTVGSRDPLPGWTDGCRGTADECVAEWNRTADTDGDARPGVTLTVRSEPDRLVDGEAHVVFRTVDRLFGTAVDSTRIVGEVEPAMEYRLLGSDVEVGGLVMPTSFVKDNIPAFDIPRSGATFVLLRADGRHGALDLDADRSGAVECAEIAAAESVFGAYEP